MNGLLKVYWIYRQTHNIRKLRVTVISMLTYSYHALNVSKTLDRTLQLQQLKLNNIT